jgi:L-fuconolactonase
MQKIDAHQHFWKFDAVRDKWITNEMALIRKDFLPPDLEIHLRENNFDGCVVVQSEQSENENEFQLANAENYSFVKGIVGWVDLQKEDAAERLAYYHQFKKIKGFRHILQGEPQRDLMLHPRFINGIRALQRFNFTYDLLIFPDQLKFARDLVALFPQQKFVIDHLAKPYIKDKKIDNWQRDMMAFAGCENVYCKISGYTSEADLHEWKQKDFEPYFDVVLDTFGTNRIMYGSDWPVSLLGGSYNKVLQVVKEYFSSFTVNEQGQFFGLNAIEFYNL